MGGDKNEPGQGELLSVVQTAFLALGFTTYGHSPLSTKSPKRPSLL